MLPIGDQPNPRGYVPWVNYLLIAANIGLFLLVTLPLSDQVPDLKDQATLDFLRELLLHNPGVDPQLLAASLTKQLSAYDLFLMRWGYRPGSPSLLALFSSMFLHGGWLHLAGNMLFLWIYGDNVEHRLGRLGYLLTYLGTGVVATLIYALFAPESAGLVPLVGASGAISGILGLYFLWFPRNKVRLLVVIIFFVDVWVVNARLVLGFYLLIENLLPFLFSSGAAGGVAHGAHLGGFVAGLAVAFAVDRVGGFLAERSVHGFVDACEEALQGADAVRALHASGDYGAALGTYLKLLRSESRTISAGIVADLGDWAYDQGQAAEAFSLYRRGSFEHPTGPHLDRFFLGMGLVLLHQRDRPTAAYQVLLDALDTNPTPEVEHRVREALAEIETRQKRRFGK
ncbi:MAG: rhomboid family intramembrane serine protease [Deltaproteobacteria bacterium]|nr:rhomboid family intramembrane serine protease [Deltaproteobacteria bacterium]